MSLSVLLTAFLGLHSKSEHVPYVLLLWPEALGFPLEFERLLRESTRDDDLVLVSSSRRFVLVCLFFQVSGCREADPVLTHCFANRMFEGWRYEPPHLRVVALSVRGVF